MQKCQICVENENLEGIKFVTLTALSANPACDQGQTGGGGGHYYGPVGIELTTPTITGLEV